MPAQQFSKRLCCCCVCSAARAKMGYRASFRCGKFIDAPERGLWAKIYFFVGKNSSDSKNVVNKTMPNEITVFWVALFVPVPDVYAMSEMTLQRPEAEPSTKECSSNPQPARNASLQAKKES